jgi:hypothetical protein
MKRIFFVLISACLLSSSYLALGFTNYIPLPASANPNPVYPGAQEQQLPDAVTENIDPAMLQKIKNDFDTHICLTDDFDNTCQWYLDEKNNDGWTLDIIKDLDDNCTKASLFFWKKGLMGNLFIIAEGEMVQKYYGNSIVFISAQGILTSFYSYYNSYSYLFADQLSAYL